MAKFRAGLTGYLFIAPLFLGLIVFYLYAFAQNIFYSFNDVGVFGERTFVGIENFQELFQDPVFLRSLSNTFFYAGLGVPLVVVISVCLAWLLNQKIKGQVFYRTAIFIPGLQRISSVYYDAAQIDGANTRQIFFKITLPLLSPTIFFVTIVSMIGMLQVFDLIFLMIRSESVAYQYATSLVTYFYETAFALNLRGYGAAISVVSLILIFAITFVQFRLQRRWVHYD